MTSLSEIRIDSIFKAKNLGYPINPNLPLLGGVDQLRDEDELVDRVLVMNCLAACAFGYDRGRARTWLRAEKIDLRLNSYEGFILNEGASASPRVIHQVEGIHALLWCLGIVKEFDFGKPCSD